MKNLHFKGIMDEQGVTLEQLAKMTTIDLPVLQNIANAVYPMSPNMAELFHLQVGGLTGKTWRDRTNKHFITNNNDITRRQLKKEQQQKVRDLAMSGKAISKDEVGQTTYQQVMEYRKYYKGEIPPVPCSRCGINSLNGKHRSC